MKYLTNVIGSKEFQQRVPAKLMQVDKNIKKEDLYFSQTATHYSLAYKPNYPENNNGDFIVYQNVNGALSVHGNLYALVPTIKGFEDINDFEKNL